MKNQVAIILVVLLAVGCTKRQTPSMPLPETRADLPFSVTATPPDPEQIVAFGVDALPSTTHFKNFVVGQRELEEILRTWHSVSKDHWLHGYSHVGGGDCRGTVTLRDGTVVKWLVRPAGLAAFKYDQGQTVYLVKEKQPIGWRGLPN